VLICELEQAFKFPPIFSSEFDMLSFGVGSKVNAHESASNNEIRRTAFIFSFFDNYIIGFVNLLNL
jgi:hypothetical protein